MRRPDAETRRALYLHLPKTGGTTLRDTLIRACGADAVLADQPGPETAAEARAATRRYLHGEGDRPPGGGNQAILDRWSDAEADPARIRVYTGHLWFGMHEHLPSPSTYVTIVRDPVARLRSLYRHRVAHQGLAQTPAEWIGAGRETQFDNFQTRVLAGETPAHRRGPCTAMMLDDAKDHLATHFAAVGVTERFNESVVAILTALGLPMVPVVTRNESSSAVDLGPFTADLEQWIVDHDHYDAELHAFAATRLDLALETIDVTRELRRLRRFGRVHSTRAQVREWIYPARRRLGLLRRSIAGRHDGV